MDSFNKEVTLFNAEMFKRAMLTHNEKELFSDDYKKRPEYKYHKHMQSLQKSGGKINGITLEEAKNMFEKFKSSISP